MTACSSSTSATGRTGSTPTGSPRLTPPWTRSRRPRAPALVTAATGKFYSNGLDLEWLLASGDAGDGYLTRVQALLARLLALPAVTVAAVQGHAFAAGAMFTLAHDLRVMRADRGFWCLPEADIGLPFTPGMSALIQARLAPQVAHEAMVTARRYGGHDAADAAIVDRAVDEQAVRATAIEMAAAQAGRAGQTIATIKARMYAPVLAALRQLPAKAVTARPDHCGQGGPVLMA